MERVAFVLAVTFGSVFLGYVVRTVSAEGVFGRASARASLSRALKIAAIFVIQPIPVANSFWQLPLGNGDFFVFPFLGLLALSLGGVSAVALNIVLKIPAKRAASVFTSGMFTNYSSLGGLTAFAFFGHTGYAFVPLFGIFVPIAYYAVGFPISHRISEGRSIGFPLSSALLKERPYIMTPIAAVGLGLVLNGCGIEHPALLDTVSGILIPLVSGSLGFAIGLTLRFAHITTYAREVAVVTAIKFVLVPALMIPLGLLLGLPEAVGGVAFNVYVVLCFMPVAFNALVPPVVYGFDLDLANSAWVVTTVAMVPILPLLYLLLGA